MQLTFVGAAGSVTGSCHLLRVGGRQILVDCGMFQGSRTLDEENRCDFGFDPAAIDLVLLTHAHLDHCGRLPLLVKRGFQGKILTTGCTRDLAQLVLLDAAALQLENLERLHRLAHGHGHEHDRNPAAAHPAAPSSAPCEPAAPAGPLYEAADVHQAMTQMQGVMRYGAGVDIAPGVRATFHNAGHILGSAWILLELSEGSLARRLIFSGDLGNRDKPILNPPEPAAAADLVLMESTYGDRNHRSQAESVQEFQQAVSAALGRGGNVVIPTFALERAQDLLYYLREMVAAGTIPAATPVYLDSPMAISATAIFRQHPEGFNAATRALLDSGQDPFQVPGLHFTRSVQDSIAINQARGAIIMAGSGMAAGGRIVHHLRHNLGDARNSIIFVGYAGAGTPARRIIDGAREVRLQGELVTVRAQIHTIGGFSAHADHDDLIAWVKTAHAARVMLVHGEPAAAAVLARDLGAQGIHAESAQAGHQLDLAGVAQGAAGAP